MVISNSPTIHLLHRMRKRDLIIELLQLITGFGKKAAPRFELGIKDLQSSALPLGHAAIKEMDHPPADRISHGTKDLVVLSNGHGEDLIAMRVIDCIHIAHPRISIKVLPLVGEGKVFDIGISAGWLKRLGSPMRLPSGGFSNQSFRGFWADIAEGLFQNTLKQWLIVRREAREGNVILAVGDVLPLVFAWSSGGEFGFIGTPKSDYTWRSGPGQAFSDFYHRLKGSEWDPWEWFLMRSSRCQMVVARDRLTARGLRRHGVKAQVCGNPMMDGFKKTQMPLALASKRRLLLLCGSRMPEAIVNFQNILKAINLIRTKEPMSILVALGAEPSCDELCSVLQDFEYKATSSFDENIGAKSCWEKGPLRIFLGPGRFSIWASWVELGIANAGTATEQLIGLGVPAVSLPGHGPQFNKHFAKRQSRLLGGGVMPCKTPKRLAEVVDCLLGDKILLHRVGNVGVKRMGSSGGSLMIASLVSKLLLGEAVEHM